MLGSKEIKKIYENESYNLFVIKIIKQICEEIKSLNIDIKFGNKVVSDVEIIKTYIEDLIPNYESYDDIISEINKYWINKKNEIYDIYLKNDSNSKIDTKESDENIKIIKSILKKLGKKRILEKTSFNYYEKRIINTIIEEKNPYDMVSNNFPARGLINFIENITDTLIILFQEYNTTEKLKNYNQNEVFYLNKISLVKNWAYNFPKDIRIIMYNKGIELLSELVRKTGNLLTDQEIINELNNMPVLVLKKNKKVNLLVSDKYINAFIPKDNFEKNIFDYYYKDIDLKYRSDDIKISKISYSDSEIETKKTEIEIKILDNKNKKNSK